jgi:hypothetical protein
MYPGKDKPVPAKRQQTGDKPEKERNTGNVEGLEDDNSIRVKDLIFVY